MSKQLELIPGSTAAERVVSIPLSGLSLDGKAKKFVIRNDAGTTLLEVDAVTGTVTVTGAIVLAGAVTMSGALTMATPLAAPLVFASLDTTARDLLEAVAGTAIFNTTDEQFQVYDGTGWVALVAPE